MRIGIGYDIHQLVKNRDLILGGVKIPYELGLLGHSDADVLIHAIIDSMLGALAIRDIGYHFPDTDEQYKNADSLKLLAETKKIIQNEGYKINNIDSNIICQKPKLMNYIEQMRENIANVLKLELNQVSIKAKTNEKMDATGNGIAIIANAVCLLEKSSSI